MQVVEDGPRSFRQIAECRHQGSEGLFLLTNVKCAKIVLVVECVQVWCGGVPSCCG